MVNHDGPNTEALYRKLTERFHVLGPQDITAEGHYGYGGLNKRGAPLCEMCERIVTTVQEAADTGSKGQPDVRSSEVEGGPTQGPEEREYEELSKIMKFEEELWDKAEAPESLPREGDE